MIEYIDVNAITPADYNPRKIDEQAFEELKRSLTDIGFLIPILVNKKNKIIIAGHQRTKAAKALGMKAVPCFMVEGCTQGDEILFNQIHNGCDAMTEIRCESCQALELGFTQVNPEMFQFSNKGYGNTVKSICNLIEMYGNVLCCVVTQSGEIIVHQEYAYACKLLGINANASVVEDSKKDLIKSYFSKTYGVYCYDSIEKHTYVQGLAQMQRLSQDKSKKQNLSTLYENLVIPYLSEHKEVSVLDFGCGKGGYVDMLRSKGYDIIGIEFYNNNKKKIDVGKTKSQFNQLLKHIRDKGLFDVVVCDSVINSVDSLQAQESVLRTINFFSKDKVYFSGRNIAHIKLRMNSSATITNDRSIWFLDENNMTGVFREGQWYYQVFHGEPEVRKMCSTAGLKIQKLLVGKLGAASWQCECQKEQLTADEYRKALEFEFTLPLPNGKRYELFEVLMECLHSSNIM